LLLFLKPSFEIMKLFIFRIEGSKSNSGTDRPWRTIWHSYGTKLAAASLERESRGAQTNSQLFILVNFCSLFLCELVQGFPSWANCWVLRLWTNLMMSDAFIFIEGAPHDASDAGYGSGS